MHYLAEDPWPLAALFGAAALGFLVALRTTQEGKYLVRAGIALGLALLVLGIEQLWVTDNERIEWVIADLARALRASDPDRVLAHMAPAVEVDLRDEDLGDLDTDLVRRELKNVEFQVLSISNVAATAGRESRMGKATFRLFAVGIYSNGTFRTGFEDREEWDLGFREAAPGVWKVTRVSPTRIHPAAAATLRGVMKLRQLLGPGDRARRS